MEVLKLQLEELSFIIQIKGVKQWDYIKTITEFYLPSQDEILTSQSAYNKEREDKYNILRKYKNIIKALYFKSALIIKRVIKNE